MKTGNKILIVFVSFIALTITFAMVHIWYEWKFGSKDKSMDSITKTYTLKDFSYIKVTDAGRVHIILSDTSRLEQTYSIKKAKPKLNYYFNGDTLVVIGDKDDASQDQIIKIGCKLPVKKILAQNSLINISKTRSNSISIYLNNSEFEDWGIANADSGCYKCMDIEAENESNFNLNSFMVDSVKLKINGKSRVEINTKVDYIRGELTNESELRCSGFDGEINLKKDKSSAIRMYGN